MTEINVEKVRAETPGCSELIHFDNAGASLQPNCVLDSVINYLQLEQRMGGYAAKEYSNEIIERFYLSFAKLLNCQPDEIAYVENATRAWDMAFYAIRFKDGDRILTARAEYASNYLAYLQVAQRSNVSIEVIPDDESGQLSIDALSGMIDDRVKLIAITHVPTQGGLINPAPEVGRIAKKHGILYLLDACQSVGQMPIDVKQIGCDILSGTGRKFLRGPRGTGFLFVRKDIINLLEPPFIDLHAANWVANDRYELRSDARRFENWESYYAGRVGLTEAIDYALRIGLDNIQHRVQLLASSLRNKLSELPTVTVHDLGVNKCGIVSFTKNDEEPTAIFKRMAKERVNISVSPSRYARLDMKARKIDELARASVHYYNTEEEVETFCEILKG